MSLYCVAGRVGLRVCVCVCTRVCAGEVSGGDKEVAGIGKAAIPDNPCGVHPPALKILNKHSKKEETILICFHSRL